MIYMENTFLRKYIHQVAFSLRIACIATAHGKSLPQKVWRSKLAIKKLLNVFEISVDEDVFEKKPSR